VRILILTFGLVATGLGLDILTAVLWLLAVATVLTTFHRLYAVWARFKELERTEGERP
jgi:hypothetical protein